ncbi:GTP-binding protein [Alkalihalobacillus oceani]|uniref:CobW family GTP-binding protein n=1 Tax=Halalkalibacter oceani TaxID=1653776 RepID=UPI00203FDA6A|nr:GTP-binding protein [Halalkalibacter oceani]MCM3763249.1 GTP-binding protein [Halalkalibacter oceani]
MGVRNVDIYILAGFLGSGKSTLLTRLLQAEKENGRRVGVLMNELGEISIDSSIVPPGTPLLELLNGCICCTINAELSQQVNWLLEEHELDAIYIEATGAAHPIEVIDACSHPILANKVKIMAVITHVDVMWWKDGKMSLKVKKLLNEQVKFADILVLNKTDQLEADELSFLMKDMKTINSQAKMIPTTFSQVAPDILYERHDKSRRIDQMSFPDSSHGAHVHHDLHLHTFQYPLKAALDRIHFSNWLKAIPGHLYRAKGFVTFTETPGLFLFNYSYGEPIFERVHTRSFDPVLIFIGDGLDHQEMENDLLNLQAEPDFYNKER